MALPFLLAFALLFQLSAPPRFCSAAPASSPPPSLPPSPAAAAAPRRTPLVPALFVIGDSTADVGTNNYLGTLARADREPYGRDFDTRRPTGRFSNGRIPVDYIGTRPPPSRSAAPWLWPLCSLVNPPPLPGLQVVLESSIRCCFASCTAMDAACCGFSVIWVWVFWYTRVLLSCWFLHLDEFGGI